ncbi:MAG: hypothetical protein AAFO94_08645 [Bacteroidota bacterium]
MCGITGFLSHQYKYADLRRMTSALRHRGPDADGFFYEAIQGIALGHRRLSIIDLSEAANQPFYSKDGRYIMVFNGEVYNFREIREDLLKEKSIVFETSGDSEVIIEALAHWGVGAVQRFNGMFAIGLWDRYEQELYLIRDRIGIKPLYYYYDGTQLAFASELKALLQLPLNATLDTEALQDYLFLEYIPAPKSIIAGVKKLEKGHYLKLNSTQKRFELHRYYHLLDQMGSNKASAKTEAEWSELFAERLQPLSSVTTAT